MSTALEGYRGDSTTFDLTLTENGEAIDLTNTMLWFTMKERRVYGDDRAVVKMDSIVGTGASDPIRVENGIEILDPPGDGRVRIFLPATGTNGTDKLKTGTHVWDIQLRTTGVIQNVFTLLEGTYYVKGDITRRVTI